MSNTVLNSDFVEQLKKPPHGPGGFEADHHRCGKARIEFPHLVALVRQGPLEDFPGVAIQHRNRLLGGV